MEKVKRSEVNWCHDAIKRESMAVERVRIGKDINFQEPFNFLCYVIKTKGKIHEQL